MLLSCLIVILMIVASMGFGSLGLRILGCPHAPNWAENWGRCFALGIGIIGWFLFWMGIMNWLTSWMLIILVIFGCMSFWWGKEDLRCPLFINIDWKTVLLVLGLFVSLSFDLLEALAPPADADTLAYHFALPKYFLTNGRIEFVPIAVQGAIPLLLHMTYTIALGLGGEMSLTLWTFTTQLFTSLTIFGIVLVE